MSIDAISWAWKQDLGTPTNMIVLLHLADSANDLDGQTYYSLNHIAKRCCCSRSTVIRQLKQLVKGGYITLVREAAFGKSGNVYRVNHHLSKEARVALSEKDSSNASDSPTDDSSDTGGCQSDTGKSYPQPVSERHPTVNSDSGTVTPPSVTETLGGVTEESVGVTVTSVGVSESDPNPNLLTQKNPHLLKRAQGPAVDNSFAEELDQPKTSEVEKRIAAVLDVFRARGCLTDRLELEDSRMLLRTWLAHNLTVGKLEAAMADVMPDEVAAMKCRDPIRTVNAVLYPQLTGRQFDSAEETRMKLRSTPKGVNEADRTALLKAAGVKTREAATA